MVSKPKVSSITSQVTASPFSSQDKVAEVWLISETIKFDGDTQEEPLIIISSIVIPSDGVG